MLLQTYGQDKDGAPKPVGAIDLNNADFPGMYGKTVIPLYRTGAGVYLPAVGTVSGAGAVPTTLNQPRLFPWTIDTPTAVGAVSAADPTIRLMKQARAANDTTLNIAYANGTAAGLTPNATSVHTTPGSLSTNQVETQTIVGTVTSSGNMTVTITAAGLSGSGSPITVAVVSGDTAAVVANKIRTALAAVTAVAAFFFIDVAGFGTQQTSGPIDTTNYLWAQLGATSDQPFTLTFLQSPVNDFSDWGKCLVTQSDATLQFGTYRYLDRVLLSWRWVQAFIGNTATVSQQFLRAQLSLA